MEYNFFIQHACTILLLGNFHDQLWKAIVLTTSSQVFVKKEERNVYLSSVLDFPYEKRNNNGKHIRIVDISTAARSFGPTMNAGLLKHTATDATLDIYQVFDHIFKCTLNRSKKKGDANRKGKKME